MNNAFDENFKHEKWSSGTMFTLATVGAAVGLGNIWRFPYIAGQNGGAAFVVIYLGFVLLIGVPLMMAELAMGRRGGGSAIASMRKLVADSGKSSAWCSIGWLSILIPLIGLSYYSVVAGWSIDYIYKAATNAFDGFDGGDSAAAFNSTLSSPARLLFLHGLFIASGVIVVARGVGRGIEVVTRYLMPALFVILLVLVLNSFVNADMDSGIDFLFAVDFSKITPNVIFMALGQALFSLAIGVGVLLTFGAYVPEDISLPRATLTIALADTGVAVLAGLAIFPVVFANGLDPAEGPGLIFVTLPIAFGSMPGGYFVGLLFFVLLFLAAFSTLLGMLEPAVSYLEEHRGYSRPVMTVLAGGFSWLLGVLAALSFNVWSEVRPLGGLEYFRDKSIFDLVDFLIANLLLPLNAMLIALFAGWAMSASALRQELRLKNRAFFGYVRFVLCIVAPIVVLVIFYTSLG